MIKLNVLGSGSKGNAIVICNKNSSIVVDLGFSRKEIKRRMELLNLPINKIKAALLTHEHSDHSNGCRIFCDELLIPLYAASLTADYLRNKGKLPKKIVEFETGTTFKIEEFEITPFSVQHDAVDPVGFIICHKNWKIGIATDLGDVNALVKNKLKDCDILILESNYDKTMLINSDRQLHLKRRIMGKHGHLDNVDAIESLDSLLTERTKFLLLAHLSEECNELEMVEKMFLEHLEKINRKDIHLEVLQQNTPSSSIILKSEEL